MALSDRLEMVNPSEIRKLFDLAQGIEGIISLGIGEPDFDTPEHIKEYAKKALDKGLTHYSRGFFYHFFRCPVAHCHELVRTGIVEVIFDSLLQH